MIENIYNQILSIEQKTNVEEATKKLNSELQKMGFENYLEFMIDSLLVEIISRNKILDKQISFDCLMDINKLHHLGKELTDKATGALKIHQSNRFQALNLEITSANSELTANSMGKIAHYFQGISQGIKTEIIKLNSIVKSVNEKLKESQFLIAATDLVSEMVYSFEKERLIDGIDLNQEKEILKSLASHSFHEVYNNSLELNIILRNLKLISEELANSIGGLEFVRITGKIEASTLDEEIKFRSSIHEMSKVVGELKKLILDIREKQEIMFKRANDISSKIRFKNLEFQYAS